jgi:hypothetical protein
MPAALPIIAAAPRPIECAGREWLLRPMSLDDWAEFEAWIVFRFRQMARRAIPHEDPLAVSIHEEIEAQARKLYLGGPVAREIAASPAGRCRYAWYHARRDNPGIDAPAVAAMLDAPGAWDLLAELEETLSLTQPGDGPARDRGPLDFRPIYRLFAMQYAWPPEVVGRLTLAQTLMYLDGDKTGLEGFEGPKDVRIDPVTGRKIVRCSNLEEASALIAYLKRQKETRQ